MTNYHKHATLSDGTDISRMTRDEIDSRRSEADREFFARARKRSPQFPDIATGLERQRQKKEDLAARILIALAGLFLLGAPLADHPGGMLMAAGACFVGFVVTCFVARSRRL